MPSYPVFEWTPDYSMVESVEFHTEITFFESGVEQRRKRRERGLRIFKLNFDLLDQSEMDEIWDFFIDLGGPYGPFLYRDFLNDYLVEREEPTGVKNGVNTTFYLSKKLIVRSSDCNFSPVARSPEVYKNGILLVESVDYTLDYSTGELELAVGPLVSDKVTVTYEFYYLVRFMEDILSKDLFEYIVYRSGINLKEIFSGTGYAVANPTTINCVCGNWDPNASHSSFQVLLNTIITQSPNRPRTARGCIGTYGGKWYWEFKPISYGNRWWVGVGTENVPNTNDFWVHAQGYGYYALDGKKYNGGSSSGYGDTWTVGDIIGVALDMDSGKIWFRKNGVWQNSGNPSGGTNAAFSGLSGTFYPMASEYFIGGELEIITSETLLNYAPPTGFFALCS